MTGPKKNKRSEVITPQAARDVFEMYASVDEGIKSPVEFEVSPTPSPITAVYGFIAEAKEGDKIIPIKEIVKVKIIIAVQGPPMASFFPNPATH